MGRWDSDPRLVSAAAQSIAAEEDRRTMRVLNWEALLREVRHFYPGARLVSHIHDEWYLDGIDPDDPHFKRHMDAFKARVPVECDDPMCVVGDVHDR